MDNDLSNISPNARDMKACVMKGVFFQGYSRQEYRDNDAAALHGSRYSAPLLCTAQPNVITAAVSRVPYHETSLPYRHLPFKVGNL